MTISIWNVITCPGITCEIELGTVLVTVALKVESVTCVVSKSWLLTITNSGEVVVATAVPDTAEVENGVTVNRTVVVVPDAIVPTLQLANWPVTVQKTGATVKSIVPVNVNVNETSNALPAHPDAVI